MKIVITGASKGIGKILSEHLISRGYNVWGLGRSQSVIEGGKYSVCNVDNITEIEKASKEMSDSGFIPDCVIIGAAIRDSSVDPMNIDNLEKTFNTNVFGAMNTVKAFIGKFKTSGNGHFILLSSISAFRSNTENIFYPGSKSSISIIFKGLDQIYRKKMIPFSIIFLGPVNTEMWEGRESILVASPELISEKIECVIKNKRKIFYTPFISTILYRISFLVPDSIYSKISHFLLK